MRPALKLAYPIAILAASGFVLAKALTAVPKPPRPDPAPTFTVEREYLGDGMERVTLRSSDGSCEDGSIVQPVPTPPAETGGIVPGFATSSPE